VPELAGQHSHRRVFLGAVSGGLLERFYADGELFQPAAVSGEGFLSEVGQEPPHPLRSAEHLTVEYPLQFRAELPGKLLRTRHGRGQPLYAFR
jgi:hypothetical protein